MGVASEPDLAGAEGPKGAMATGTSEEATMPSTLVGDGTTSKGTRRTKGDGGDPSKAGMEQPTTAGERGEDAGKTTRPTLDASLPSMVSLPGTGEASRGSEETGRGASKA